MDTETPAVSPLVNPLQMPPMAEALAPAGQDLVGQPITFTTGPLGGRTLRFELEEIQKVKFSKLCHPICWQTELPNPYRQCSAASTVLQLNPIPSVLTVTCA